jgi:RNA polymerase sigma-70 factor (ECF subfamily)
MSDVEPPRGDPDSIRGLMARIQAGDEEAARELLNRYEAKVRLVVRRQLPKLLRSRFDSLDFLQSVWGSFFHKIRTGPNDLHEEGNLVAFLAWAARNKVIDEYRRAATQRQDIHRETSVRIEDVGGNGLVKPGETPSQLAQAREMFGRLRDLLPEDHRIIVEMKAAGYSSKEIGNRIGISERTVQRVLEDLRSRAQIEG